MESIPEALLLRRFTSMLHIIFLHGGMPLLDEPGTHRGVGPFRKRSQERGKVSEQGQPVRFLPRGAWDLGHCIPTLG